MSNGRPPLSDDGGRLPDPQPGQRAAGDDPATAGPPAGSTPGPLGDEREPNYLARRAIAIACVVVVIAISAIVIGRAIGENESGGSAAQADDSWNSVVVLAQDEIRVIDPSSGETLDTFPSEDDLLDAQSEVSGPMLVTMTDAGKIVQTDLRDGTTHRSRSEQDAELILSRANPQIGIAGPAATGGDLTIIDTRRQASFQIGDIAGLEDPLMFPDAVFVNSTGSHLAVSDARSFQTVVVDIVEETAELIAGQAIAIDDATVVTAQRAGDETELEFYDLVGERVGRADVATPSAVLLTPDHDLLLVTSTGEISKANADGDVDALGPLAHPDGLPIEVRRGEPTRGNTRLVVQSSVGTFIVDDDGDQLALVDGDQAPTIRLSNECVTVNGRRAEITPVQLDLADGSVRAELEAGFAARSSFDGCTNVVQGVEPPEFLRDGETSPIPGDSVAALAPDGGAVVATTGLRHQLLRPSEDDEPVDVANGRVVIHFANR
jgi:hypothetical protein